METKTDISKTIVIVVCVVMPLLMSTLCSILCCSGGIFWFRWVAIRQEYTVAEVKLDDNQTIKVWYETCLDDDGAGLHYYEISQGDKVIHPTTEIGWLELSRREDYQVALNHDKTLVCVYDSAGSSGLFVLYNTQNGDLWTRGPAYDQKDWQAYYEQLKAENPDLPSKSFFQH